MVKDTDAPWVQQVAQDIVPDHPASHFYCARCGAREPDGLPALVDVWVATMQRFVRKHRKCLAPTTPTTP